MTDENWYEQNGWTPLSWPTCEYEHWWMEYQRTARSRVSVLLVSVVKNEGAEYIQPFQDRNCYPRSFTSEWRARFLPCPIPPEFPPREEQSCEGNYHLGSP